MKVCAKCLASDSERLFHGRICEKCRHKARHELVGKMPDVRVASLTGISPASVCLYRKKMGISMYRRAA